MPRPVPVLCHARNSALLTAVAVAGATLAAVMPAEEGAQLLGPVTNAAMSERTMNNRAEQHPYYAKKLGHQMARQHGWHGLRQWHCLRRLWNLESSWHVHADNPNSGAYGIPQAMPGKKMNSSGPHWRRSAQTQIRGGIRYVQGRYHSPCGAMRHKNREGWY